MFWIQRLYIFDGYLTRIEVVFCFSTIAFSIILLMEFYNGQVELNLKAKMLHEDITKHVGTPHCSHCSFCDLRFNLLFHFAKLLLKF